MISPTRRRSVSVRRLAGVALAIAAVGCEPAPHDRGKRAALAGSAAPVAPREPIAITATLDGAPSETVEHDVIVPIEAAVSALPGVRSVRASVRAGRGVVLAEIDQPDPLAAVQRALGADRQILPATIPRPVIERGDPDAPAALWLAVSGPAPASELAERARDQLVPRLERVTGVRDVQIVGDARGVVVRLDPARLDALALTVADVQTALAAVLGAGSAPRDAGALGAVELARRTGAAVRLRDVGAIEDAAPGPDRGPPALGVRLQPTADPSAVLAAVRAAVAELAQALPHGWTLAEAAAPAGAAQRRAIAIAIRGPAWDTLVARAAQLEAALRGRADLVTNVASDHQATAPALSITTDRDAAVHLGVTPAELATTIRGLLTGPGRLANHSPVVLRLAARDAVEPADLDRVKIRTARGELLPLSALATAALRASPTLTRRDGERAITISADLVPGHPRAAVLHQLVALAGALPPGYHVAVLP